MNTTRSPIFVHGTITPWDAEIFLAWVLDDLSAASDVDEETDPWTEEDAAYVGFLNGIIDAVSKADKTILDDENAVLRADGDFPDWVQEMAGDQPGMKELPGWIYDSIDWDNLTRLMQSDAVEVRIPADEGTNPYWVYRGGILA